MLTQTTAYDHSTDNDDLIDCVEQGTEGERYPVLHICATTAWPSREQLVAIRDAIQGYLDAHPDVPPLSPEKAAQIDARIAVGDSVNRLFLRAGVPATSKETPTVREYTDAEVQEMF